MHKPPKLVLASGNPGKLREFQALLQHTGITVIPQSEFNIPDVEETGLSFVENAILKARNAARHSGLPALADDSGLEVDALQGAPGIYSARYAGADASDADNNRKLLVALQNIPPAERTARFQCVIVFLRNANDATPLICHRSWEGIITDEAKGEGGFGYDPFFYLPERQCTSAELPAAEKNQISHRGQAMQALYQHFSD